MSETHPALTDEASQLASYMQDISEECWHAGWLNGLEFALWHAVQTGPIFYGQGQVTTVQIRELRRLSEACGGWVRWSDEETDIVFVPMSEWERVYEEADKD